MALPLGVRDEPPGNKSSRSLLVPSASDDRVNCTMNDLKQSALGGYETCAIIYAGLKSLVSKESSFISDVNDEEPLVKFKTTLQSTPRTNQNIITLLSLRFLVQISRC
jgi:hypothetical protein